MQGVGCVALHAVATRDDNEEMHVAAEEGRRLLPVQEGEGGRCVMCISVFYAGFVSIGAGCVREVRCVFVCVRVPWFCVCLCWLCT